MAIGALKSWADRSWNRAMVQNLENIEGLLGGAGGALLDLGCDDGVETRRFAVAAGADRVAGVEIVADRAHEARQRGVEATEADLNERLPFDDESFDVVVSNQVIEHLADTDMFVAEIYRVLKPGGLAVTSTENLASWHNLAALTLGWQPFSLTNVTGAMSGLGNPLAVWRDPRGDARETWQHRRVFAYRGLRELFEAHGFTISEVRGAGYYPLPGRAGRFDPRHAAFLAVAARKG